MLFIELPDHKLAERTWDPAVMYSNTLDQPFAKMPLSVVLLSYPFGSCYHGRLSITGAIIDEGASRV